MAVSHMVISKSTSFCIWEAVATQAKVFSFDFIGVTPYYFPCYGKDFVLRTGDDLVKAFIGLEDNFSRFACDWELLKQDCNYHYDGKNLQRIRKLVIDTIREIDSGSSSKQYKLNQDQRQEVAV